MKRALRIAAYYFLWGPMIILVSIGELCLWFVWRCHRKPFAQIATFIGGWALPPGRKLQAIHPDHKE